MAKKRKRSYGAGELVPPRKPGGLWGVRIRSASGKREYRGGFATRELAERVMAKRQADATADAFGLPVSREGGGTLGEYAVSFLARRKPSHAAHAEDEGRWKKHIAPAFGHLTPAEVDQGRIRAFVETKRAEGLAAGTVRIMVTLLSQLFEDLIEDKHATANPARGLPKKTLRLMQPDHDPKTTPFIERLADIERIYRELPEPLNVAYAIGAMAGLRTGEVFALRWRHVDLQARRIHVRESVKGPVKDKDSRIVPIIAGLLPVLSAWKLKSGGELVCPPMREDGDRVNKKTPGKHLARALKKLGLEREGLGWYEATRHTFASQWVINGGSIEKLKEVLGHYSVVVTERYAHLRVDLFNERDLAGFPLTLGAEAGQVLPLREPSR
jgi:integrase